MSKSLIILATVVLGCAFNSGAVAQTHQTRPKLLVFFVIDGLPQRQMVAYRDQFADDGFARFFNKGASFTNAHYAHATTLTAPGHATMLTGSYAYRTGIVANEWSNQKTGEFEYCTGDIDYHYIDSRPNPREGTSPKNLKVETLGDVLKIKSPKSKVIGISGKDRGAILPAGKLGTAYMYQAKNGQFSSSTYYMSKHPEWVNAFNQDKKADAYFKRVWQPLLPDEAYARSLPDGQEWYGKGGKLPKVIEGSPNSATPDPLFYGELLRTPFADALILDFARAAIKGEKLGQDSSPDILSISLSSHDYINHQFSAESRLSHDHLLHLDRLLQEFFRDLDASIGKDAYIAVLTADHGFMPAPEVSIKNGHSAGRIDRAAVIKSINKDLSQRFGDGEWAKFSGESVLLNRELISKTGVDLNTLADEARRLLLSHQGFAFAYTRKEFNENSLKSAPFFQNMKRSWNPEVSGDIQFVLSPYWMMGSTMAVVANHGSPYEYDKHVPILAYGMGRIKPMQIDTYVEIVDLAPTFAKWLRIPPPPAAEGGVLPFILENNSRIQ